MFSANTGDMKDVLASAFFYRFPHSEGIETDTQGTQPLENCSGSSRLWAKLHMSLEFVSDWSAGRQILHLVLAQRCFCTLRLHLVAKDLMDSDRLNMGPGKGSNHLEAFATSHQGISQAWSTRTFSEIFWSLKSNNVTFHCWKQS